MLSHGFWNVLAQLSQWCSREISLWVWSVIAWTNSTTVSSMMKQIRLIGPFVLMENLRDFSHHLADSSEGCMCLPSNLQLTVKARISLLISDGYCRYWSFRSSYIHRERYPRIQRYLVFSRLCTQLLIAKLCIGLLLC